MPKLVDRDQIRDLPRAPELKGRKVIDEFAGHRITRETLVPLVRLHGERWNIWPSSEGAYACATLRRGLSWTDSRGRLPVGAGGAYVRSLVADSLGELKEAIKREDHHIAALLADGTLKVDE